MQKYLVGAAVAALMLGFGPAHAAFNTDGWTVDPSNSCGFTDQQLSNGFVCYTQSTTTDVHREIGNNTGLRCQAGTETTTTYAAVNKGGNLMDTRTATTNDLYASDDLTYIGPPVAGPCP